MPSPLEELMGLLGPDELRGVGMDQLKRRMLTQMLLQDPVAEGDADPTARDYIGPGSNRPESQIKRYVPGSKDPGLARNPDLSPQRYSDMGDLSPTLIADYQNRGRPDLGGAEMDRAAGMGVIARGGGAAKAPLPNLDTDPAQIKIRLNQLLYDRSLLKKQGHDIDSAGYAPNAQIQELRARLRALQGQ